MAFLNVAAFGHILLATGLHPTRAAFGINTWASVAMGTIAISARLWLSAIDGTFVKLLLRQVRVSHYDGISG